MNDIENRSAGDVLGENIGLSPTDMYNRYNNHYQSTMISTSDPHHYGVVEDNDDPEKFGRCRVRVFGVFDSIPVKDLPWASPNFGFVGGKKGSFVVPTVGTIVSVMFNNGELYLPEYSTKVLDKNNMPTNKDVDYPHTMVFFETDDGDSFEINRKSKVTTYTHSSGTKLRILADGSVDIDSVADITTRHADTLTVQGNKVTPTGVGPLNAINVCPFSGALHTGMACSSLSTFDAEGSDIFKDDDEAKQEFLDQYGDDLE